MKNRNKTKLLPHLGWPAKKCDYRPLLYCCITTISSSFSNIRFVCIFICDHHISRRKKGSNSPSPLFSNSVSTISEVPMILLCISVGSSSSTNFLLLTGILSKIETSQKCLHNQFSQGLNTFESTSFYS